MSKINNKLRKYRTAQPSKRPKGMLQTRSPRNASPKKPDGFPQRFVAAYDLEAVKKMVAKLRQEALLNNDNEDTTY